MERGKWSIVEGLGALDELTRWKKRVVMGLKGGLQERNMEIEKERKEEKVG